VSGYNLEVMAQAERYNRFLLGLVLPLARRAKRVLDFGAGSGTFARPLSAQGVDVIAVEPDAQLRAGLPGHAYADIAQIPDGAVDLAYSFNVLEHIEDDAAALAQLRRVLKPGGRLLLYVPAFMVLYTEMDRRIGHLRRYRKQPLKRLAERCGFTVEDVRYADSLGYLAALAFRVAGPRDGALSARAVKLYDRCVFPLSRLLDRGLDPLIGKNLILRATKA
jgi:SAM-dependent methyltransferase